MIGGQQICVARMTLSGHQGMMTESMKYYVIIEWLNIDFYLNVSIKTTEKQVYGKM